MFLPASHRRWSLLLKLTALVLALFLTVRVLDVATTSTITPVILREPPEPGRNLAALQDTNLESDIKEGVVPSGSVETTKPPQQIPLLPLEPSDNLKEWDKSEAHHIPTTKRPTVLDRVKDITSCLDRPLEPRTQQRGDYWVLYNYVRPERRYRCHESVTYTTHADYSFLDNLVPLLERWQGPISIALHAPGTDFANTLESLAHLRDCTTTLVKEFVTFHVYFSTKHVPKEVPKDSALFREPYNCSLTPPYLNVSSDSMYKNQKKLLYPVNVGRNVARETAQTHFILPSDIELYPSPDIIPKFLAMIAENSKPLTSKNPKVYPLHIFEITANQSIPDNKTVLREMLKAGTALPFHKKLCPSCHGVPKSKEWQDKEESEGLHVFHVGKRNGRYVHWEPIFIGTHTDPLYDERLSWEGKSDKMTQGYALCVLNYDFLILDNAFLVHKPGIKIYKKDARRNMLASKTNQLIRKIIFPELKILYGVKKGCAV